MLVDELKILKLEREKLLKEIERIKNLQVLALKLNELEEKKNSITGVKRLLRRREIQEIEGKITELRNKIAHDRVEAEKIAAEIRMLEEKIDFLRDAEEIQRIYTNLRAEEKYNKEQKRYNSR